MENCLKLLSIGGFNWLYRYRANEIKTACDAHICTRKSSIIGSNVEISMYNVVQMWSVWSQNCQVCFVKHVFASGCFELDCDA